jgi:epoxyqueuosine reductase
MNRTEWTRALKGRARELGFDLVGIAPATPAASGEAYEHWLAQGYAGEMAYLARPDAVAKRRDPRRIMPTVRSIVVVGMNYYSPFSPLQSPTSNLPSPAGRISRYAWGDDYHGVMAARLKELAAFLGTMAGRGSPSGLPSAVEPRIYVDTGPLLEREWAARAGLGWVGKNTNLLNKRWGSWFFLGEILTSLELDYDVPTSAHCGTCTRCLQACPTGALVAPYVLDARRCISYLTIELRGPIPRDLRPGMGNWIFGCDLCQEVCPWNRRHARPTGEPAFRPRPGLEAPALLPLFHLTPEEFEVQFAGSPLRRAGRRGLRRNIAVALGNSGDPEAIPALRRALRDPEPLIRGHAAWALGRFAGAGKVALQEALAGEEDPWVREEIALGLQR